MAGDVLDLRGVGVRRDGATLLHDVTWAVDEGDRWVIAGPNGAGKTTLLQVAAALLYPTEGAVRVLGEELGRTDVFELRPRIGIASAAVAERVPAGETVLDLVLTASYAILGRWREEYDSTDLARAAGLLEALGCGDLIGRRFDTLSEGERKRVQIARALMPDPELLLLDEPAAGLDLGAREDLVNRLGRLADDPAAPTMVMVTHHVEEVPPGVTHALLLRKGGIVAQGKVDEVFTEEHLSACFGVPLGVDRQNGRWYARTAR
ncbi:ABC transporter ATP-binding protein [Actinomadura macrotermitis]|uniref:Putative ABC transporter ATP-binding protein YlmA n=1 Tax=Actinomadura macrotermitis TaxID=2585200 RepID=A0A7K0BWF0_9ACTN|nr:ABC transporter ATP-binding protein [Actinomadura macrotermitis]MQY05501.1 putative ABC transporter ATP-binding protein YlmA [Actinomadura macrotermitis]